MTQVTSIYVLLGMKLFANYEYLTTNWQLILLPNSCQVQISFLQVPSIYQVQANSCISWVYLEQTWWLLKILSNSSFFQVLISWHIFSWCHCHTVQMIKSWTLIVGPLLYTEEHCGTYNGEQRGHKWTHGLLVVPLGCHEIMVVSAMFGSRRKLPVV